MAMYLDGLSKAQRDAIGRLFRDAKAWHTDQAALRALPQKDLSYLEDLVEKADAVCEQILDRLPLTAVRARTYLQRFVRSAISYLRALLKGEEPLPTVTTNAAENVFSQINIRLKKIGRRWSLVGALNMLRVLLAKVLNSEHWEEYLKLFSATPGAITVTCAVLPYYWINS